MFTGIVEELGTVGAIDLGSESAVLRIEGPLVVSDAVHGASIAVNGVCLTVTSHDETGFTVDVMAETLRRSSLGGLQAGDRVNLERAMAGRGRSAATSSKATSTALPPSPPGTRGTGGRSSRSPCRPSRRTSSRRGRSPSTVSP